MLTDAILDSARQRGDALADATVATIFKVGDTAAVARLLATLMRDDQAPPDLAAPVVDYLARTSVTAARSAESAAAGERIFAEKNTKEIIFLPHAS